MALPVDCWDPASVEALGQSRAVSYFDSGRNWFLRDHGGSSKRSGRVTTNSIKLIKYRDFPLALEDSPIQNIAPPYQAKYDGSSVDIADFHTDIVGVYGILNFIDPKFVSCPIPSVKCVSCDAQGIEIYVIKGKICPRCGAHCG